MQVTFHIDVFFTRYIPCKSGLRKIFTPKPEKCIIFAGATFVLTPNWRGAKKSKNGCVDFS
jgi:hypothetical protein